MLLIQTLIYNVNTWKRLLKHKVKIIGHDPAERTTGSNSCLQNKPGKS